VEKFREVTPLTAVLLGAHMLNFKPIFGRSFLKIVGGPRPLWGVR